MYDVRPQESALERLRNEIEYILDDDTAGEVRITYLKDGHSEIKDAKVLLVDDIMHHFKKSLAQEYSRGATKELDWVLAATNNPDDPCYAPKIAREVADRIVELEKGQEDGR